MTNHCSQWETISHDYQSTLNRKSTFTCLVLTQIMMTQIGEGLNEIYAVIGLKGRKGFQGQTSTKLNDNYAGCPDSILAFLNNLAIARPTVCCFILPLSRKNIISLSVYSSIYGIIFFNLKIVTANYSGCLKLFSASNHRKKELLWSEWQVFAVSTAKQFWEISVRLFEKFINLEIGGALTFFIHTRHCSSHTSISFDF